MSGIVISPFSNSNIRDWPAEHYAALIGLILDRWTGEGPIRIIGTKSQRLRACDIVRAYDPTRVLNDCGRLSWPEVLAEVKSAACVIGNNSGLMHLAGFYGVPTVCVFGGSHQRLEWRPLGFDVQLISYSIGCSPCHLDHRSVCPYDKACLRRIAPEMVADAVFRAMAQNTAETRAFGRESAAQNGAAA